MRRAAALAGIGLLALAGVVAHARGDASFEQVERGRYLAVLGDCAACHTAPGGQPFAGGVPIETPFGRLVGANITPDPDTGIGNWTLADFQGAMSRGVARGGAHLYGAMPYTAYTRVTAADNAAIWAYLQSLEPVRVEVETNLLPFPFSIRLSLLGWNMLNFTPGEYVPDPQQSEEWNRGAYIVQGLGHCGTCHTPKSLTGGDVNSRFVMGGVVDGWLAPDITGHPHSGIGAWSVEEIAEYLRTGANRYDIASGPMADVVRHSSQHWTEADLRATAVYLRSLGGQSAARTPAAANTPEMTRGAAIYADRCSGCHVGNGQGIARLFPRLAEAPLVVHDDPTSLIRVVLAGSRAGTTDARPTGPAMPSFAWNLSDDEVAAVLTYVRNSWGNAAPVVAESQVRDMRRALERR
ncbi:c-type cytochrome [Roseococcus sp.]|uniref:c-type cytochrome n=1 Tax=Roseococcus sp. TaxID=2109646 RepID=UPI003BA87623